MQARQEAIRILESVSGRSPRNPECSFTLVEAYLLPFRFLGPGAERSDPEGHVLRAVQLSKDLVSRYPQVPKYWAQLAQCHFLAGQIVEGDGRSVQAERHFQQAVTVQRRLVEQHPSVGLYRFDLLRYLDEPLRIARRQGGSAELQAALEQFVRAREAIPAAAEGPPHVRRKLADAYGELAGLLAAQGSTARAAELQSKAKAIQASANAPPRRDRPKGPGFPRPRPRGGPDAQNRFAAQSLF